MASLLLCVLSAGLWVAALFRPAFIQRNTGATQYTGLNCLLLGWFGLFGMFQWGLPWLANAFYAMGLFGALFRRFTGNHALTFSLIAIPLALVTYVNKNIPVDEAGNEVAVTIGPAFYFWLASLVVAVAAILVGSPRKLAAVCVLLAACMTGQAQDRNMGTTYVLDLRAPIRPASAITFAGLLRQVCAELEIDPDHAGATVSQCVKVRELGGKDAGDAPDDGDTLQNLRTLDAKIAGKPQIILMFQIKDKEDPHPNPFILALFEMGDKPRLLDIVEAPSAPDDTGDLWSAGLLHLSPTADAFVFETNHSNSQQGYRNLEVLFVSGGRIQTIDGVMLLSCKGCADGNFEEAATIVAVPTPGREFANIVIRVNLDLLPDDPGTERPQRKKRTRRTFTATYSWDPATHTYSDPAHALAAIASFNDKNY